MSLFTNKTLLITGGTGSFGNAVLNRFLGTVDTLDITRLRRYLAEESVDLFPGADMNGDGAVDIEDLTCLRRYLVEAGAGLGE